MADFPAGIRCSTMAYLAGRFPAAEHRSIAGNQVEIQGANRAAGGRLLIGFRGITRAELHSIRSHYQGEGTTQSWLLSAVLLDGAEYASEISTMRWRYLSSPAVRDLTDDVHDVDIELEHVPVTVWIDRVVATARPVTVAIGGTANLIGAEVLPTIWASRLLTTTANGGPPWRAEGHIGIGADGANYQAFWFTPTGSVNSRIVVVKRSAAGVIAWQRWTNGGIEGPNAGVFSMPPIVAPLAGGGCVVAARYQANISGSYPMFMWCLNNSGAVLWEKQLSVTFSGPIQLAHVADAGEVLIAGTGFDTPTGRIGPALLRLNANTGAYIAGRMFYVGSAAELRRIHVLGNSNIIIIARMYGWQGIDGSRSALVEVSSDLLTVNAGYGYGNPLDDGNYTYDGPMSVNAAGDVFIMTRQPGILRLNSMYGVTAHYQYPSTDGGRTLMNGGINVPLCLSMADDGNGWALTFNSWRNGTGPYNLSLVGLADSGSGVNTLTDLGTLLDPRSVSSESIPNGSLSLQVNANSGRVVIHAAADGATNPFNVMALGYAVRQSEGGANALDVGGNTVYGISATPAPGSVSTGQAVTRTTLTVTDYEIGGSAAATTLPMVDSAASLTWAYYRLIA